MFQNIQLFHNMKINSLDFFKRYMRIRDFFLKTIRTKILHYTYYDVASTYRTICEFERTHFIYPLSRKRSTSRSLYRYIVTLLQWQQYSLKGLMTRS